MLIRGLLLGQLLILLFASNLYAQGQFVYTNNDVDGPNSVSGFSVAESGALTEIAGSPFLTGGTGGGGGFPASNHIVIPEKGNLLYAANIGSANISAFQIDATSGALTPVAGSPFLTGAPPGDISLAISPDNQFLFAANVDSGSITVFSIGPGGVLTPVAGSPFPAGGLVMGIKVSPNGKFLAAALPLVRPGGSVAMFNITASGALIAVAGSPFAASPLGQVVSLDINCQSNLLFASEATSGPPVVSVFSIAPDGTLTLLPLSPLFTGFGTNSSVALLSADGRNLFISNQNSSSITVFSVSPSGNLSLVSGIPFFAGRGRPAGLAIDKAGALLFAAISSPNSIAVFSIASDGSLTPVAGSPFPTGKPGTLSSLAAFPPQRCPPVADLTVSKVASPAQVTPGSNLTYTITITNNGPGEALSITISDLLPASLTFISCASTAGGVCGGTENNRTISFASLAPGSSAAVTIIAKLNESVTKGTVISNTATVTASASFDPNPANNSATAIASATGPPPKILGASVVGRKLIVVGQNFDVGAVVLLNGEAQVTVNDDQNPSTRLVARKAGQKIAIGQTVILQVRNPDGALSQEFAFTRTE
jgi:6-phosphogluconolactonase